MKKLIVLAAFLACIQSHAQDSAAKKPVQIFSSTKAINARTTEVTPKGKMDFNVTHNFGDIGGKFGGTSSFFGLDNATDVRIAFSVGLARNFDATFSRSKGFSRQKQLYEFGVKYKLMDQLENDPSHPLALAVFANLVIAANPAKFPNLDDSYSDFSDRVSNVLQLIIAKRMGKVSLQLNPTLVTRGHAISYDKKSYFALGGALRVPITHRVNLVLDYFRIFRDQAVKDSFRVKENLRFYDPLGIGFEILTSGHIFRLNFTNTAEILENRFIPRSVHAWHRGEFRWGFTISRMFTLWRKK